MKYKFMFRMYGKFVFYIIIYLSLDAVKFILYSNRRLCPIGKYAAP